MPHLPGFKPADAITYDPQRADDSLWRQLYREFTEPGRVEVGYWIGFTFGGQRRLKTLATKQDEFEAYLATRESGA